MRITRSAAKRPLITHFFSHTCSLIYVSGPLGSIPAGQDSALGIQQFGLFFILHGGKNYLKLTTQKNDLDSLTENAGKHSTKQVVNTDQKSGRFDELFKKNYTGSSVNKSKFDFVLEKFKHQSEVSGLHAIHVR